MTRDRVADVTEAEAEAYRAAQAYEETLAAAALAEASARRQEFLDAKAVMERAREAYSEAAERVYQAKFGRKAPEA